METDRDFLLGTAGLLAQARQVTRPGGSVTIAMPLQAAERLGRILRKIATNEHAPLLMSEVQWLKLRTAETGKTLKGRDRESFLELMRFAEGALAAHAREDGAQAPAGYGMRELEDVRVACLARVDAAAQQAKFAPEQRAFALRLVAEISGGIEGLSLPVGQHPNGPRPPAAAPAQEPVAVPAGYALVPADDPALPLSQSRLPFAMIQAGIDTYDQAQDDLSNYVAGETVDWDTGMIVVAIFRAMLAAAPVSPAAEQPDYAADDARLPCDVHLPPSTYLRKGVLMRVFALALAQREGKGDDLTVFSPPTESGEVEDAIQEIERLVYGGQHDGAASLARACKVIRTALASTSPPQPADHRRVQDAAPARPDLDALIAEAKAQAPQPGGVKVKALKWSDSRGFLGQRVLRGCDLFGNEFARLDYTPDDAAAEQIDAFKSAKEAEYRCAILSAIEPSPAQAEAWKPTHRHPKRGSEYRVIGEAQAQVSCDAGGSPAKWRNLHDGNRLTVYQGADGNLWVRFSDEFSDGRFQPLPTPPAGEGTR